MRHAWLFTLPILVWCVPGSVGAATVCTGGFAGPYPCENVDLFAVMPLAAIGGGIGNDVWGWTDPLDGKEYAIMGRSTGVSFVDISNPESPVYLGNLPPHTIDSVWRDMETYQNHVFVVSEAAGHGMQVFDLTQLRTVVSPPVTFGETAHYAGFGEAHTVSINEATGFAYANGSDTCSGGMHVVNIQDPVNPTFAGCVDEDGYVHDAQCVVYVGLDTAHLGAEVCFNSNADTLTIVDVTNKAAPVQLSRTGYAGSGYTHQGWLTSDHRYFLLNDELDEVNFGHNSRTYVWDVADLDAPQLVGAYTGPSPAVDHNLYIHNGLVFEANYRSGVRILSPLNLAVASLTEIGFFDTVPADDAPITLGTWSVYPFFASGVVIASDMISGLFILKPQSSPPSSSLDHYKCYQGTDLENPPFGKLSAFTTDQITPGETVEVQKVKFVCSPVDKNGEGINDPATHLVCYQIKGNKLVPRPAAELSTQFQSSRFELKKPKLLCLPGTKSILP